jgi:cytochrome P450
MPPNSASPTIIQHEGWPIIGILPEFLTTPPIQALRDIVVRHGGFVELQLGTRRVYLVSDPAVFQHVLRDNHKNYPKPDLLYGVLKKVAKNGLLTSEGDFWLRQRRMIQPHFHREQLANMARTITESIATVLDGWQDYATTGEQFDLGIQMSHVTMKVITRTMFGQGITSTEMEAVAKLVPDMLSYLSTRGFIPFIPEWVPLPVDYRFERNYAEFKALVLGLIDRRRQKPGSDLISMLLNSVDDETSEQMTDDQLLDEAITIFAAGFETTATTLTWLWYILEQHPEIVEKMRQEISSVLGRRAPTAQDVPHLPYIKRVISECLRMYPPVPLLPRTSVSEDYIGKDRIPANATILLFYYGLHHNPQVWEAPEEFHPDRFLPDIVRKRSRFAWLPFSAGPRKCVGDEFAMMEATLATTMILQRFEISVTEKDIVPHFGVTLRPSKPLRAVVKQRYAVEA